MEGDSLGEVTDEALSSAREGPAGKIAKCMLDSMIEDASFPENAQEGDAQSNVGDDTTNTPQGINNSDVTDENPAPASKDANTDATEMLKDAENTPRLRNISGKTYKAEFATMSERELSMTDTLTSTEVGDALVNEVMDKVTAEIRDEPKITTILGESETVDNGEIPERISDEVTAEPMVYLPKITYRLGHSETVVYGEIPELIPDEVEPSDPDYHSPVPGTSADDLVGRESGMSFVPGGFIAIEEKAVLDETVMQEMKYLEEEKYEMDVEKEYYELDVEAIAATPVLNVVEHIAKCAMDLGDSCVNNISSVTYHNQTADTQISEDSTTTSETEDRDADLEPLSVEKDVNIPSTSEVHGHEEVQTDAAIEYFEEVKIKKDFQAVNTGADEVSAEHLVAPPILLGNEDSKQPSLPPVIVSVDDDAVLEERNELEEMVARPEQPGRRLSATLDDAVKIEKLEETIAALRKNLIESDVTMTMQQQLLRTTNEQLEAKELVMQLQMRKYEVEMSELMGQLRQLKDASTSSESDEDAEIKDKLQADIKTYQEQIKQDAIAICALEERLDKVVKKSKEYQVEVKEMSKTVHDLKTERQALVLRIQQLEVSPPQPLNEAPPPMPRILVQRPIQNDYTSAEIAKLSKENSLLKSEIAEHLRCIEGLRRDLAGADARLSDMAGELSESQKEALEEGKAKVTEKEDELSKVKGQMKELNDLVEKYKTEVVSLKDNWREQKNLADEYRGTVSDQNVQIKDLQNQLTANSKRSKESANQNQTKQSQQNKTPLHEGHITKDLTVLGSRCKGERHDETIYHQREALAELRSRVKALEQIKPSPSTTQDQALSQIFLLKRELAELRAKQASQTLDQRHHIIRKIRNQVTEDQEDVVGSTEGHSHGNGMRPPSPSIGLPSINKSLESKQRLTALLKDPKNTRPRIYQNGGEFALEEKPSKTPRSAWMDGHSSGEDSQGRGTPSIETDMNFTLFRHPAPPEGPRRDTARSSSRPRPRSAALMQGGSMDDGVNGRESFETLSSKRSQAELELERSALSETSKALDLSEEIYLETVKTLGSQLGLSDIPGVRSLAHLPQDERNSMASKRLETLQVISTRVGALKERIDRKDQLLQGYETDLEKLRNAEQANQEFNAKVENLSTELRTKTEEGHYLRESLSRAREKLDQEIRLNSAIKTKKTFHLENEFSHRNTTRNRPTSATDEKKKKDHSEVLRKKNYELKQLKTTLSAKEKELYDVKRRYTIMQDMQKNIHKESSDFSSRRSSARSRPPLQSKQLKRQSQSSISFQEGVVEIPMESESAFVSQSEELTTTVDQSEEPTTGADQSEEPTTATDQSEGLTAESQSELMNDVIIDQSEDSSPIINQSEAANDDIINNGDVANDNGPGEDSLL